MSSSVDSGTTYPWESSYPSVVNWRAPIPSQSLFLNLERSVRQFPDRPCLEFLGAKLNYRETEEQVNRLAKGLQDLGIKKGARVGLFLMNSPLYVIAYYAILKIGGTVVNFNPLHAEPEIAHELNDSSVDTIITLDIRSFYQKLNPLIGRTPLRRLIIGRMTDMLPFPKNILFPLFNRKMIVKFPADDHHLSLKRVMDNEGNPTPVTIDPQADIAVLQYTGGTTGEPKGAMLTHANVVANAEQSFLSCPRAKPGQEKMLCVIPFFHVFAMTAAMNLGLRLGAELIMMPRFHLKVLLKTIHRQKPTMFPAVPTLYAAINSHPKIKRYNLKSLRFCISGGAPLPMEVKHLFEKNTGCILVEGYGLTEASPVVCVNPLDALHKEHSIGLPLPQTVVQIRGLDNPHHIMPLGERGELCVRGPQVMRGYWNKPEETAKVFVDGFLRTGDVAYIDPQGYVFIVDRIKDMIISSGYNVYPRNIEDAIYKNPAVEECIIIGVPDSYRGESAKAFVKLFPGKTLTEEELKTFLEKILSPIEMPKFIEFRDTLPKTLIGKLDRKALRLEEKQKQTKKDEK